MDINDVSGSCNPVAQELLSPFSEDDISENNGLAYVDPARYRARLLEIFDAGFRFEVTGVMYVEALGGIQGEAHFVGEKEGVTYDITATVFHEMQVGRESGDAQRIKETYNQLNSIGLKACAINMGLGLHMYLVPAKKGGATNSQTNGSTTKTYGDWDGSITFKKGKHAGEKYADVDDEYIEFLCNMDTPSDLAIKERNRRKGTPTQTAPQETEDEEVPF